MPTRPATPDDDAALKAFRCTDGDEKHLLVVQSWVRKSLAWLQIAPDAHLTVVTDDEEKLLAVAGHQAEPHRHGRFIPVVACAVGSQGDGIGRRLTQRMIEECFELCPDCFIEWNVDEANTYSKRMLFKLGFVTWTKAPGGLLTYRVYPMTTTGV